MNYITNISIAITLFLVGCETLEIPQETLVDRKDIIVVSLYPENLECLKTGFFPVMTKDQELNSEFNVREEVLRCTSMQLIERGFIADIYNEKIDLDYQFSLRDEDFDKIIAQIDKDNYDFLFVSYPQELIANNGRSYEVGGLILGLSEVFGSTSTHLILYSRFDVYDLESSERIGYGSIRSNDVFKVLSDRVRWVDSWDEYNEDEKTLIIDAAKEMIWEGHKIAMDRVFPSTQQVDGD